MIFWDSSAIVPLLVDEPSSQQLLDRLEADSGMLVWWGSPVECSSAIARREREGDLSVSEASQALERLQAILRAWHEILPSEAVRQIAQRLLRVHDLRAGDALQLAAAIVGSENKPASLAFLSLDERLNTAALREGFPLDSSLQRR